jgi:hypothetical protein
MTKADLAIALKGVEGWLADDEAWELHMSVASQLHLRPINIVEIGSWKGRSTIAMALALPSPDDGRVIAIDPHLGSLEAEVYGVNGDTLPAFTQNIRRAGVEDRITIVRATSRSAWKEYREQPVHVLFVDGSHAYDDVLNDVVCWTSNLVIGGVVGFNDWWQPEVWQVLHDYVLSNSAPYANARLIDGTLFVAKTADGSGRGSRIRVRSLVALSEMLEWTFLRLPTATRHLISSRYTWKTRPEMRRRSASPTS